MGHIKKTQMPKSWPVPRKGGKNRFVAVPSHATSKGISLLFLLRDVLKLVKTRKEARHMTFNGMVKVNNKVRKDENFPVQVFDVVNLSPRDDPAGPDKVILNYKLEIVNKKFSLVEISAKEADSVGDSVVLNTKETKIVKVLPLKEGAKIEIILGKHAGEKGELVGFEELTRGRNYQIKLEDKNVSLPYKTILVIA